MELDNLGFNDWFRQKLNDSEKADCSVARVTTVNKDSYLVRNGYGEVIAELAGEFIYSAESIADYPVVGDWVLARYYNDNTLAIIYGLLPRKTILRRKVAGKKIDFQTIASNIDVALIVQSEFNRSLVVGFLVSPGPGITRVTADTNQVYNRTSQIVSGNNRYFHKFRIILSK